MFTDSRNPSIDNSDRFLVVIIPAVRQPTGPKVYSLHPKPQAAEALGVTLADGDDDAEEEEEEEAAQCTPTVQAATFAAGAGSPLEAGLDYFRRGALRCCSHKTILCAYPAVRIFTSGTVPFVEGGAVLLPTTFCQLCRGLAFRCSSGPSLRPTPERCMIVCRTLSCRLCCQVSRAAHAHDALSAMHPP